DLDELLWVSDGTSMGTQAIGAPVRAVRHIIALDGVGYFLGELDGERGLWKTDGTLLGTELVQANHEVDGLVALDGSLFYTASGHVWISDGTEAGTQSVSDNGVKGLGTVGSRYFFIGDSPDTHEEVWSTDGTPEGTYLVFDLLRGPQSQQNGPRN